jgi:hypothetical protein
MATSMTATLTAGEKARSWGHCAVMQKVLASNHSVAIMSHQKQPSPTSNPGRARGVSGGVGNGELNRWLGRNPERDAAAACLARELAC